MSNSILVLIAMTVITGGLALYRKIATRDEDDYLHVSDPTGQLIAHQRATDQMLRRVDRIGITLTIVTAVYGLSLIALFLYNGLTQYRG